MVSKLEPNIFFATDQITLILSDTIEAMSMMPDCSVDMIFADPPYFLSNNGITCNGGKMVSVNKGSWDKQFSVNQKTDFNKAWLLQCRRILKPNATIWISGTYHNIFNIGYLLEELGFSIINNITWQKKNPPPNLACRCFTHSTETIIWAKKKGAKHLFNYDLMKQLNEGKQMKDVWTGALTPRSEKSEGKHPTQKPIYLLERLILASTNPGDVILDPFTGSSTTGVAAKRLGRKYIGIDSNPEYLELSQKRLQLEIL